MDWSALLQQLGDKASANLAGTDASIGNQAALAAKQVQNPDYTPSAQEAQGSNDYYNNVMKAVAGSVAPENPAQGILGKLAPAKAAANEVGQNALEQAVSQNGLSKATDMANRYQQQYAQARAAALAKIRGQ